ncbi:MAG: hypothetical protein KJ921_03705 [Proteobacteria bacterium]|nr:hypothetical protein [Pseudomonadota bacterium]
MNNLAKAKAQFGMLDKIIIVIALLLMFCCFIHLNGAYAEDLKKIAPQQKSLAQGVVLPLDNKDRINIVTTVLAAIVGALVASLVSFFLSKRQRKKEYRSLILSFCSESVFAFERCIMYKNQAKQGQVSYSALYSVTDASAISKLASACDNPEVITAIIGLKSNFFQIQRHVEEAAKFAIDGSRASHPQDHQDLMKKAMHAQGTALAFFDTFHEKMEKEIEAILNACQETLPGKVSSELYERYSKSAKEY